MSFKSIFLFLFVILAGEVLSELPPGITPCSRSEPPDEYDKCVLQQLMILTPQLIKGIPSLKLPPLDPLSLPSLVVDRNLDAIRVKANLTNVRVYGASNYEIDELRAKPNDLAVFLRVRIPYIHVKGNYDVKGNLLLLTLNGNGAFRGNFTNTQVRVSAQGKEIVDKNEVKRIELSKLVTKLRIGDGNIKLKAPPTQVLTADAATSFFNSNPRLVLDIINPIIEETSASIGKALAARALGALSKDEILP
ncbi:uncharacterized protein LOC103573751 [Microplitis demolitor]|uniref:uncharacterized protein LOC103573751 n=1 Tax=Microplitis demolitor TaxID=69319 RepID=UPI0004CD6876|nr:uncharacterized protein LOC103573751 [Microplitis demolitor]